MVKYHSKNIKTGLNACLVQQYNNKCLSGSTIIKLNISNIMKQYAWMALWQ